MVDAGAEKTLQSPQKDIAEYWHVSAENSEYDWSGYDVDKSQYRELLADILSRHLIQPTAIGGFEGRVSQLLLTVAVTRNCGEHFERRKEKQEEVNRRAEERREQAPGRTAKTLGSRAGRAPTACPYDFRGKEGSYGTPARSPQNGSACPRVSISMPCCGYGGDRIETSKGVCVGPGGRTPVETDRTLSPQRGRFSP